MNEEKLYEQLAVTWRHFALWREKSFAGYLTLLAGLSVAFMRTPSELVRVAVIGAAVLVSIAFWVLDFRNGQLLNECQTAAAALEGMNGVFSALNRVRFRPSTMANYALAVDLLVAGIVGISSAGLCLYAPTVIARTGYGPSVAAVVTMSVSVFVLQCIRRRRWQEDRSRIQRVTANKP